MEVFSIYSYKMEIHGIDGISLGWPQILRLFIMDMHYNIILGFAHSSQSLVGRPDSIGSVKEGLLEELTVQQAYVDPVDHVPA